jgi:acyl carrier protein
MALPTVDELATLVRALLAEILEMPPSELALESDLVDDLGLDSLQQLELMTSVEQQLRVHLDIEDWRGGRNIAELAERVRVRLLQETPT